MYEDSVIIGNKILEMFLSYFFLIIKFLGVQLFQPKRVNLHFSFLKLTFMGSMCNAIYFKLNWSYKIVLKFKVTIV